MKELIAKQPKSNIQQEIGSRSEAEEENRRFRNKTSLEPSQETKRKMKCQWLVMPSLVASKGQQHDAMQCSNSGKKKMSCQKQVFQLKACKDRHIKDTKKKVEMSFPLQIVENRFFSLLSD